MSDNADFKCTLDVFKTIHIMGSIACVTPSSAVLLPPSIPKLKKMPSENELGESGSVSVLTLHKGVSREVIVQNLKKMEIITRSPRDPSPADVVWLNAKRTSGLIGGWSGFMEKIIGHSSIEKSKVLYLPFIDSPPSNCDTIYTTLMMAKQEANSLNQKSIVITFDQPLYHKANEIVFSLPPEDQKRFVIRSGGFHLLMSFLGCVGHVMAGSGLQELLSSTGLYARNSIQHMLTGHAYARSIRAHFLVHTSLSQKIWKEVDLTTSEQATMDKVIQLFSEVLPSYKQLENNLKLIDISSKFSKTITFLASKGPTAKLWIEYFKMISLIKTFIRAERSGDWNLHLACVKTMIPYFYACGHHFYSRSAHMYLQDMLALPERMCPDEYQQFVCEAFTIRRTDKLFTGTWSDMIIEQSLMRGIKSDRGLTRGRGMTKSVQNQWIMMSPMAVNICDGMEKFADACNVKSDQHIDWRETRVKRDERDIAILHAWFEEHIPFIRH